MSMAYEEYMKQIIQPMRDELTTNGFKELTTPEDVEQFMENVEGTTLVVINSVCGCAAGLARPAAITALQHEAKPDHFVTVFAGQDREATEKMREYIEGHPPSSPSMALFDGKKLVHFIPREEIENRSQDDIIRALRNAFEQHCQS